jgi:hypothetical protein
MKKVLEIDRFVQFVGEYMDETKLQIENIFEVVEKDGEVFMNVPENMFESFQISFPDFDFEGTLNNFVKDIINKNLN